MPRPTSSSWTSRAVRKPKTPLTVEPEIWQAGRAFLRLHRAIGDPLAFNPGLGPHTRFAPIWDRSDRCIPTMYGADGLIGALSETVFRDLANAPAGRRIDVTRLRGSALSTLAAARDLVLARWHGTGLTALGTTRRHLIEPLAAHYPSTARWAEAIHDTSVQLSNEERPLDGLIWRSRQNDDELVLLLFGGGEEPDIAPPRVAEGELRLIEPPLLLDQAAGLQRVIESASSLYIHLSGLT